MIFNRPELAEKVFETIRQVKPPKLLVIADGPRVNRPSDAEKCVASRAIIERVDWQCEVMKNYSDVNMGNMLRTVSGFDWVFNKVEEAIIVEDDCLPQPTFFRFCEELLDYYRHDARIMTISGDNSPLGNRRTEDSYYFSRYPRIWGWATWRRAWLYYDIEMRHWPKVRDNNLLKDILQDDQLEKCWKNNFQLAYERQGGYSWDYPWTFASWIQGGLSIIPNVNLVSNLGFSPDATHTTDVNNPRANMPVEAMKFPLDHPKFMIRDMQADEFTHNTIFKQSLLKQFKAEIKKKLNR